MRSDFHSFWPQIPWLTLDFENNCDSCIIISFSLQTHYTAASIGIKAQQFSWREEDTVHEEKDIYASLAVVQECKEARRDEQLVILLQCMDRGAIWQTSWCPNYSSCQLYIHILKIYKFTNPEGELSMFYNDLSPQF